MIIPTRSVYIILCMDLISSEKKWLFHALLQILAFF